MMTTNNKKYLKRPRKSILLSFFIAAIFSACASDELKRSDNPEVVYNEGVRLLEKEKDYLIATEFFNEVRRRFPQSRFATLSELKQADLEFNQDNYTEAAALYGVFVKLYPTHPQADYALFREAESFFRDSPEKTARDQSSASQALASAQRLIQRYPQSQHVTEARVIIEKSRLKLAQKEAYVAEFYEKRRAWPAALERWKAVLSEYPDLENSNLEESKALYKKAHSQSKALTAKIK
jgi:outer membrane protein assembly factor BamD